MEYQMEPGEMAAGRKLFSRLEEKHTGNCTSTEVAYAAGQLMAEAGANRLTVRAFLLGIEDVDERNEFAAHFEDEILDDQGAVLE